MTPGGQRVRPLGGGEAIVLQGRCQATGEGITFQPVAEVLRAAASTGS